VKQERRQEALRTFDEGVAFLQARHRAGDEAVRDDVLDLWSMAIPLAWVLEGDGAAERRLDHALAFLESLALDRPDDAFRERLRSFREQLESFLATVGPGLAHSGATARLAALKEKLGA